MGAPRKVLAKNFIKKGQVLNPLGGRAHNPVMKALKNIGREQFSEIIMVALKGDVAALEEFAENKRLSVIQMGVVQALKNAALRGDWPIFKDIVEQLIGSKPKVVQIEQTGMIKNTHVVIPPDLVRQVLEKLEDEI